MFRLSNKSRACQTLQYLAITFIGPALLTAMKPLFQRMCHLIAGIQRFEKRVVCAVYATQK
jgi:hypothetical protein